MSTTITIPGPLARHLREAMIYELGRTGRAIAEESERKEPDLPRLLEQFDVLRAALDGLPAKHKKTARVAGATLRPGLEALRGHTRSLYAAAETARQEGHSKEADHSQAELDEIEAGLDHVLARVPVAKGGDA
jgi:hypothetical protein